MSIETPIIFNAQSNQLIGIVHHSQTPSERGVVIVVGGPQTRIGSHRSFVELARFLAENGVHVFRFDYTGAGDSQGEISTFTDIVDDIHAAIDAFRQQVTTIQCVNLWGLCDAASAIALYLNRYPEAEINNVVLVNPWVNHTKTQATAYFKHYYLQRLLSKAFWLKLFKGKVAILNSAQAVHQMAKQRFESKQCTSSENYVKHMLQGLTAFRGACLFILAQRDLTGQAFDELVTSDRHWRKIVKRHSTALVTINDANHTFAKRQWKDKLKLLSLKQFLG